MWRRPPDKKKTSLSAMPRPSEHLCTHGTTRRQCQRRWPRARGTLLTEDMLLSETLVVTQTGGWGMEQGCFLKDTLVKAMLGAANSQGVSCTPTLEKSHLWDMGIAVTWNSSSAESVQFRPPCSDPGELCANFCWKAACLLVIPTHKGIISLSNWF